MKEVKVVTGVDMEYPDLTPEMEEELSNNKGDDPKKEA